jgi:pimeloyl-ACP methyl ester carboxylesterase
MDERAPVKDETLELNGLRFHYRDWGNEGAAPLLLLHFFTWHARIWDTVAGALRGQYRVLALDQRGHGESEWADDYAAECYLEDLEAFARALELRRLRVIGFSVGGHSALRYAARHPEAIERLVLGETLPEQRAPARAYLAAWLGQPDVFDDPEGAVRSARGLIPRAADSELRHWVLHNLAERGDGRWTWRYDVRLRTPGTPGPRADPSIIRALRPEIACPTLVVRGAESEMFEADQGEEMAREIPNARLVEIPDAGHWVPLDNPDGVLAALRDFLDGD